MENFWEINGNFWSRDEYSYDLMEVSNKGENE